MPMAEQDRGEKQDLTHLTLALKAEGEQIFQLILEQDFNVVQALLNNPRLKDEHLRALLKHRDLPEEIPSLIFNKKKTNLSHQLLLALVKNPSTPGALFRNLLPNLRLFELLDLCYLPGVTPDQRGAAERTIIQRLPMTPVGNKITLARRATAVVVAELLREGDARTVETCLNSSRLKEGAVSQFLKNSQATATTISMVARNSRWNQRPNLRLEILKNRLTPDIWFITWLTQLPIAGLNQLLMYHRQNPLKKKLVQEAIKRRTTKS